MRRARPWRRAIFCGCLGLLASLGCHERTHEPSRADPGATGRAGADGGLAGRDGGEAGRGAGHGTGPTEPRTVSQRSPFGNVEPGNLIMNGDFELGIGAVVPGWYAVADDHVMAFRYRTGGACRSGLLCAEIAAGQSLVATMVSLPTAGPVTIVAHAKPRSGRLGDVTVRLVMESLSGAALGAITLEEQGTPDALGFGRYQGSFEVDRAYDVVSLVVEARDSTLVDDVSVRAGAPAVGRHLSWPDRRSLPPSAERATRIAHAEARGARRTPTPLPPLPSVPGDRPVAPRVAPLASPPR